MILVLIPLFLLLLVAIAAPFEGTARGRRWARRAARAAFGDLPDGIDL